MQSMSNHVLSLVLLAPLAGALLILMLGRRRDTVVRWIAAGASTATLLVALPLWFAYDPHGKTWQFAERGDWMPFVGDAYYVGLDGFGLLLVLLAALISCVAVIASWQEISARVKEFYVLVLMLEVGALGVFMSLQFLLLFLSWGVVLVALFLLIQGWGRGDRERSALDFGIYAAVVGGALLAGIVVLSVAAHTSTGAYSFDIARLQTISVSPVAQKWVFFLFFLAFGATVAMFPMHWWLPGAQSNTPTAVSLLLAALVLKMGAYGFVRVSLPILPDATRDFAPAVAILAVIALACGAFMTWRERDWVRSVAYVSVCQMTFAVLGMFLLTPTSVAGAMLQQISHGVAAAGLLLIAGSGHQFVNSRTRGLTVVPRALLLIMLLSIAGVPSLSGFVGQAMIARGMYASNISLAIVAVALSAMVSVRTLWLWARPAFGSPARDGAFEFRTLTPGVLAAFAPLVALTLWIGVHPTPFISRLETSMGRVVARVNPAYAPYVALGSDCATPAAPDPAGPPPGFLLTESCADGSETNAKPAPPADGRH